MLDSCGSRKLKVREGMIIANPAPETDLDPSVCVYWRTEHRHCRENELKGQKGERLIWIYQGKQEQI